MKQTLKAAVAAAAVAMIGTAGAAKADLNISGETGLILNPTAAIVEKGHPQIQANYYDFGSEYDDTTYGLYGAIQVIDNLEVSGGIGKYTSDSDSWDRSGIALGAKYRVLNQDDKGFDLAVGAGYNGSLQKNTHVYVAASKAFGANGDRAPIEGTLGLRWDQFKFGDEFKSSKASVYAGVQIPVVRSGQLSLIGEIQSKNFEGDAKFPYAIGLRYHPKSQAFSITAGLQRHGINSPWESSSTLFVQAGYTFGR